MPWIAAYTDAAPLPNARPLAWYRADSSRLIGTVMPDVYLDAGPVPAPSLSAMTLALVAECTCVPIASITYAEVASQPHG